MSTLCGFITIFLRTYLILHIVIWAIVNIENIDMCSFKYIFAHLNVTGGLEGCRSY